MAKTAADILVDTLVEEWGVTKANSEIDKADQRRHEYRRSKVRFPRSIGSLW